MITLNIKFNSFTHARFCQLHKFIKLVRCPHCKQIGFLIFHGYLYGFKEDSFFDTFIRARRIFCSNRFNRLGCGKTVSIFVSPVIKGFTISTSTLWRFLCNIFNGMNIFNAFHTLHLSLSNSTVYRLHKRFRMRQSFIRTQLTRILRPPHNIPTQNPLIATILHIKTAFNAHSNPLTAFQETFQTPIL